MQRFFFTAARLSRPKRRKPQCSTVCQSGDHLFFVDGCLGTARCFGRFSRGGSIVFPQKGVGDGRHRCAVGTSCMHRSLFCDFPPVFLVVVQSLEWGSTVEETERSPPRNMSVLRRLFVCLFAGSVQYNAFAHATRSISKANRVVAPCLRVSR